MVELPTASMYARFWNFLLHRQHQEATATPTTTNAKRRRPCPKSPTAEMRVRVRMLHELEALLSPPTAAPQSVELEGLNVNRAHRHRHPVCANCGQRYFRDQGPPSADAAYCSLDCRSSREYRADVQRAVDHHTAFGPPTTTATTTTATTTTSASRR